MTRGWPISHGLVWVGHMIRASPLRAGLETKLEMALYHWVAKLLESLLLAAVFTIFTIVHGTQFVNGVDTEEEARDRCLTLCVKWCQKRALKSLQLVGFVTCKRPTLGSLICICKNSPFIENQYFCLSSTFIFLLISLLLTLLGVFWTIGLALGSSPLHLYTAVRAVWAENLSIACLSKILLTLHHLLAKT